MKLPYQKVFMVCAGARCNNTERGVESGACIRAELKEHNKKLGRKRVARILEVSCLDLCDHGPNMAIHPDGTVYSYLNRETARAVYDDEMGDGPRRPDLELDPRVFEDKRT